MKHTYLRRIILVGGLVLTGLLVVQVYWFNQAFDVAEKQFDHSVQIALKKVADSVSKDPEIQKLSSSFFLVTTNTEFDNNAISDLVRNEFLLRHLDIEYELGIYNALDDTLVYGHYVEATMYPPVDVEFSDRQSSSVKKNFAIFFPRKKSYLAGELGIWIFSTIILLLMMGFFAYAIYSLLREQRFAELKNDFISNMTHEFKTPVTNIRIAGEVLTKKFSNDETAQVYLSILLKENEKLRHKIDQVLLGGSTDFIQKPVFNTMDIHQLIADCAETFQMKVREREGSILLDFHAGNPSILGDRELLMHAFSNVIDNAEKYSVDKPHINVSTRDTENGIEIDIVDRGIGIPSVMKEKVFEKFFRVQSGDVHTVKGFGLGLSFVKNVIRSHKGRVNLFSEVDKGTVVTIFLPRSI